MAALTPQEIATGASCFSCIDDRQTALLYVFDQIRVMLGGAVMTPQEIVNGSVCMDCLDDRETALLYLADQILEGGGGQTCILCGAVDPSAPPDCDCALYYNKSTGTEWYWDADLVTWVQFSFGAGASGLHSGNGDPNGVVAAPVGDIYTDLLTGNMWPKMTGSGNTGWGT